MSGALGKSENQGSNTFNQDVWGPSGDAMQNLYGQVGNLFGGMQPNMQSQSQAGLDFSQGAMDSIQNPWQQQMQGGAYQDMGLQDNLTKSLSQSLNSPTAMQDINSMIMGGNGNNYADAMKQSYVNDADTASQNMLRNLDARASAAGMSGGSGYGTAVGQGFKDINTNLQRNLAQTGFGAFDKDLDRKLQIANQADQNTFGRQQLMSSMIGDQQNTMNTGIEQGGQMIGYGNQQQMLPWQQAGAYGNILGGPQVLSSGSGNTSGKGFGISAAGGQ